MSTNTPTSDDDNSYDIVSTWLSNHRAWEREYSTAEFKSLTEAAMAKMEKDFKKQFNEEITLQNSMMLQRKSDLVQIYGQMEKSLKKGDVDEKKLQFNDNTPWWAGQPQVLKRIVKASLS